MAHKLVKAPSRFGTAPANGGGLKRAPARSPILKDQGTERDLKARVKGAHIAACHRQQAGLSAEYEQKNLDEKQA